MSAIDVLKASASVNVHWRFFLLFRRLGGVPTGRHVVATGENPWWREPANRNIPNGVIWIGLELMSSLRDYPFAGFVYHGFTPMATTCRHFVAK